MVAGLQRCPRCINGQLANERYGGEIVCVQCGHRPGDPLREHEEPDPEKPYSQTLTRALLPVLPKLLVLAFYTAWQVQCMELGDFDEWLSSVTSSAKHERRRLSLEWLCEETEPDWCAKYQAEGMCAKQRIRAIGA